MQNILPELLFLAFLLVINALFSMSEMAVVSSKKTRLAQWASAGNKGAQVALDLANSPGRMLSTVQIGITCVGILSGVVSGANTATFVAEWLVSWAPILAPYSKWMGVGLMVSLVTYLNIVVGELLPKRLAMIHAESIASSTSFGLQFAAKIGHPLVTLLDKSTEVLLKLLGRNMSQQDDPITEEELKTLVQQGTQAGVFQKGEQDLFERALSFSDKSVHAIMTPKHDIVWLDITESFAINDQKLTSAPHSHFPVVRSSLETVLGTVHIKDVYSQKIKASDELGALLSLPLFIPDSNGCLHVLEMFKRTGVHIAFIIDEYGSLLGLVTLTDLLEGLVGGIALPSTSEMPGFFQRADGSYLIDAMIPIDQFKSKFGFEVLPDEKDAGYQTVAGFVLMLLGKIPKTGDRTHWKHFEFEIVDMDGKRIDKILMSQAAEIKSIDPVDQKSSQA
jgi:putative hemolysin